MDLFDKGYHRNPAAVAKDAIAEATKVSHPPISSWKSISLLLLHATSTRQEDTSRCRKCTRCPPCLIRVCGWRVLQLGYDVVLVDTAGRMQNKEPLMRALAELISDNNPDLTLFVGEALVGNDGIDQLSMFNMALANYSPPGATPFHPFTQPKLHLPMRLFPHSSAPCCSFSLWAPQASSTRSTASS